MGCGGSEPFTEPFTQSRWRSFPMVCELPRWWNLDRGDGDEANNDLLIRIEIHCCESHPHSGSLSLDP